jgi:pyrroline-5-carboxylate reductase
MSAGVRAAPVGLIGAGALATALARGCDGRVLVTDGGSGRARALAREVGAEVAASNAELARAADFVVLCHPARRLAEVAAEIDRHARCVVSPLSGVSLDDVQRAFPRTPVARIAVNLLAEVRASAVWYGGGLDDHPELERAVLQWFGRLGVVRRLDERLFPAAIAVSGVGPAYLSLVVEAHVEAAIRLGLDAETATEAAVATVAGTAELLRLGRLDTLALRRAVAAPGGPTSRGLAVLERAGIRQAFHDAADAVVTLVDQSPEEHDSEGHV